MKMHSLIILCYILFLLSGCGMKDPILTEADDKETLMKSDYTGSDINSSDDIVFTTEYPVYSKDITRITCFLKNNTKNELIYGEEYVIEKLIDREWYKIPFPDNAIWHSIAIILSPESTKTEYISLTFPDYTFTDGSYRVVKQVGDHYYAAAFELGSSGITADTPYGFQKLEQVPKDYTKEDAVRDGVVVVSHNSIENGGKIVEFIDHVRNNTASMLRVMQFTDEGDPIIKDIIYTVEQDNYFIVKTDNTRDNFGSSNGIIETIYSYIVTDGYQVFLSNYAGWVDSKDNIPLIASGEVSKWKDIVPMVDKITEDRLYSNGTTYKLFQNDASKSLILTENPLEFGYNSNDSISEIRVIENSMNIATKITEALWADNHTILIVCGTDTVLKYYEFFDIQSRSVSSYKASTENYRIENGKIVIPDSKTVVGNSDGLTDGSKGNITDLIKRAKESFVCNTTTFEVNGQSFDLQDIDISINAITEYAWFGTEDYPLPYIILICHINPAVGYCTIFDVEQMTYVFSAYGNCFSWQKYTAETLEYAFDNCVYNYWGDILYRNEDSDYEIYHLQSTDGSNLVTITLANPQNEDRKEVRRINYHRDKEYDIRNDLVTTGDQKMLAEFRADLLHDGSKEELKLSSVEAGGEMATLEITDDKGKLLWLEQAGTPHAGWNSVYLCSWKGSDYLLVFNPYQCTGTAEYTYELFYFNSPDTIELMDSGSCSFSYEAEIGTPGAFNEVEFRLFADKVNTYLKSSYLLMSTENGELKYSTPENQIVQSEDYETEKWVEQIISNLY